MTISNRISLDELLRMAVGDIAALPAEQLALLQDEAAEALRRAKTVCDWLDGAVALKYGDRAHATRQAAGKDTGTVRFDDGAVTVIADLPKRVDWDQDKLAASYAGVWVTRPNQAARFSATLAATPSVNVTPSMTKGNWFAPFRRRHVLAAA